MTPPTVESPIRARLGGPLKLAIPRGALWEETLDALDRIGLKTAEVRGDSRSLVFNVNGLTLVTMRPSDVPTYVEAGAADLGITGKDVLLEQQGDRIVYEILDLAYGACRMVLAGRQGDPSLGESERRVGGMRIATKYPRIAERHFEETGRHADVIEVKGSVELAPLVGTRRRDRRPGGHGPDARGERPRDPRGDRHLDGAAGRQSRVAQAARRRGRRPGGAAAPGERPMRFKRFDWDESEPAAIAEEIRALQPALGEVSESVGAIIEEVRSGGDEAVAAIESRFGGGKIAPDSFRVPDDALGAAASRLEPDLVAALDTAASNIRAVAEAQLAEDRNLKLRQGQSIELREVAVASAAVYAPGGRGGLSLDGFDGLHPGERRRCEADRPGHAARSRSAARFRRDPRRGGDRRRHRGLRDRRRPGDCGAGAGYGADRGGRRDRRARKPLRPGGQAPARRRRGDRRDRRALGADGDRGRTRPMRSGSRSTSAPRPSMGRTACWSRPRWRR